MHDLRHVPTYYSNLSAEGREQARLQEMADQFTRVMMDTGFAPKDVAIAFLRAGMKLANQLPTAASSLQQLMDDAQHTVAGD